MTNYIYQPEFQDNKSALSTEGFDKSKRKRMTHLLVDKPISHPFPIEQDHESLLSVGQA